MELSSPDLAEARAHGALTLISTSMEMVGVVHYHMGNKKSALNVEIFRECPDLSGTTFGDSGPRLI